MKKIYLVALICALAAGAATFLFVQTYIKVNDPDKDKVEVVYSIADVPAGTQITSNNKEMYFAVKLVDKESMSVDAVQSPDELIGETSSGYIYAGEQVTTKRFGSEQEANAGLSYILEEGRVAYSLAADGTVGVDGFVLPGDKIDILAVKKQGDKTVIETVLSDINVLRMSTNAVNADTANAILTYSSLTLELTYDEANTMFAVENSGEYAGYKIILNHRSTEAKN